MKNPIITSILILLINGSAAFAKEGLMKDAIARQKVSSTEGGGGQGHDPIASCNIFCANAGGDGTVYQYNPCRCCVDYCCNCKTAPKKK